MMGQKLRRAVVAIAIAVALATAGSVYGGETSRGGFELTLSTQESGAPTGLTFHVLYKNPDDPDAKPPAVTAAIFELPAGTRIDDSAVPQCTATDEEFRLSGRGACPPESQVGGGTLTAMTGVPGADPVTADIVAYNGPRQLIEVVFFQGTNSVAGMDRLTIEGDRLVAHPPATPGGPPDGRTAVREVRLELPVRTGAEGRPYVSAPPDCLTGTWTSQASYEFEDGGTTSITSESPCRRAALKVSVKPRRAHAGRRITFRVTVRSTEPKCVDRALVRVAGRRFRTGPRGRAQARITFAKAGTRRIKVSKPGCRTGRMVIRVIRR